jgi:phospholipid-transporting ATPase
VERTVNKMLYLILGSQIVLSCLSLLGYLVWSARHNDGLSYICLGREDGPLAHPFYAQNCHTAKTFSDVGMWISFFTLYNNFVPISLYVTMEMVNYVQAYYIDHDLKVMDCIRTGVDMPLHTYPQGKAKPS